MVHIIHYVIRASSSFGDVVCVCVYEFGSLFPYCSLRYGLCTSSLVCLLSIVIVVCVCRSWRWISLGITLPTTVHIINRAMHAWFVVGVVEVVRFVFRSDKQTVILVSSLVYFVHCFRSLCLSEGGVLWGYTSDDGSYQ
jgi:hypothetical protein